MRSYCVLSLQAVFFHWVICIWDLTMLFKVWLFIPYYWWVILHCMCMEGKTIFTQPFHNKRQITRRKNRSIPPLCLLGGFVVKNLPVIQETWVWPLGWEDPLEKEMATHSSILAWGIPWTEEPGGLQSMGLQRGKHDSWLKQQIASVYRGATKETQVTPWNVQSHHLKYHLQLKTEDPEEWEKPVMEGNYTKHSKEGYDCL